MPMRRYGPHRGVGRRRRAARGSRRGRRTGGRRSPVPTSTSSSRATTRGVDDDDLAAPPRRRRSPTLRSRTGALGAQRAAGDARSCACTRPAPTGGAHRRRHRQRRHAVPRRLGHDGARPPRPRRPPRRAPDPARAPRRRAASCAASRPTTTRDRRRRRRAARVVAARRGRPRDRARRRSTRCATDLERVLGDVRAATERLAEDARRAATASCDELDAHAAAGRRRRARPRARRSCAGWATSTSRSSATARTTSSARTATTCCARFPAAGSASCATRRERRRAASPRCRREIRAKARERTLLVLTKANARSTVHRPTYLDYVGVKRYDADGDVIGEHRFLGLYTSSAYNASPIDVPVLRRKVAAVIERAGFLPASHDQKDLDRDPRDVPARRPLPDRASSTLYDDRDGDPAAAGAAAACASSCTASSTAASCRASCSCPRDRYTTPVRDADRATPHRRVRRAEPRVEHAPVGVGARPAALRAARRPAPIRCRRRRRARSARSRPRRARGPTTSATRSSATRGEEAGLDAARTSGATRSRPRTRTTSTRPRRSPTSPSSQTLEARSAARGAALAARRATTLDLKLYGLGAQPSLSDVLPRLTNMGVIVDDEHPVRRSRPPAAAPRWIKYFRLRVPAAHDRDRRGRATSSRTRSSRSSAARAEDDGFNRLVLARRALVARGRAAARVQPLPPPDRHAVQPDLHRGRARRAPRHRARGSSSCSSTRLDPCAATSAGATPTASSTEHRRRARRGRRASTRTASCAALLHLVLATLRTNWFQTDDDGDPRPCVVLKLDPRADPRPAAPAPDVRDLRVLAARRRRAPARRARSRAAASAGRTGAKTSAPRSSG